MAIGVHPIINILQHRIKRDVEERLIESGLNFTVLKPCDFMMAEQYSIPAFVTGQFPVLVTGREVIPVEWEPAEMLAHMFGDDTSSDEARHQLAVIQSVSDWYARYARYDFIGNPNVLTWLLGRPPMTFQSFVKDAFTRYARMNSAK